MANTEKVEVISQEKFEEVLSEIKAKFIAKVAEYNANLSGDGDGDPAETLTEIESLKKEYADNKKAQVYAELKEYGKDGFKLAVLRGSYEVLDYRFIRNLTDKTEIVGMSWTDSKEVLFNYRDLAKSIPEVGTNWITDLVEPLAREICVRLECSHNESRAKTADFRKAIDDIYLKFRMTKPNAKFDFPIDPKKGISNNQGMKVLQKIFDAVYFEDNGEGLNKYKPIKDNMNTLCDVYSIYSPRDAFNIKGMKTNTMLDFIIRNIVCGAVLQKETHMSYDRLSDKAIAKRQAEIEAQMLQKKMKSKTEKSKMESKSKTSKSKTETAKPKTEKSKTSSKKKSETAVAA